VKQATSQITIATRGKGLYEFTRDVERWVSKQSLRTGLLTLFCRHTSASLVIQENADPDVRTDMEAYFEKLVPEDDRLYVHTVEGPDDMPAHIRSALTTVQLSIPVIDGAAALGTWQGIYLFEHRSIPHHRTVVLHLLGE
jgi:secondary thiamine-phosphate synthase enzyme